MEMAMIRANIEEDCEATMEWFLHGLNWEIHEIVELHHCVDLEDIVHVAMLVEK